MASEAVPGRVGFGRTVGSMRRLRVGVPEAVLEGAGTDGPSKAWARTLAALDRRVSLVPLERPTRRRLLRGSLLDVALVDGTQPPGLDERTPTVAIVQSLGTLVAETCEAADAVVVPSDVVARAVIELGVEHVHVARWGVDASIFCPDAGRRLGGPQPVQPFVACMPSSRNGGTLALRRAVDQLADGGSAVRLVVVGDPAGLHGGPTRHPDRLEVVPSPLADRDLAALFARADAFCAPSLGDGDDLSVLEALACGTPTIVSDRGSLPEVVGDAGLVVDPHPDALANALHFVLTSRSTAEELSRAGTRAALARTWSSTAERWLAVLKQVAG